MDTTVREVSVDDGYAAWASQYDQEDNALIVLEEQLTHPILASLQPHAVLDLGSGTGRYALRFAAQGARVVALDQSPTMLAVAERAATEAGLAIDFRSQRLDQPLPFEPEAFDLVIAALVLCHLPQLDRVFADAYRALRPGGHLLVTDFHPAAIGQGWRTQFTQSDTTYLLPTAQHTRDDYLRALQQAGFIIEAIAEGLVRDAPVHAFPAEVIARDGDLPFCLVLLATKPNPDEPARSDRST